MEQGAPQPQELSPIVVQERKDRAAVRGLKRRFVRQEYEEVITVGNQYLVDKLREQWKGPMNYFQTTIRLDIPLLALQTGENENIAIESEDQFESIYFEVRLGTQLAAIDEISAIVLQSWFELWRRDKSSKVQLSRGAWKHLRPTLDIYERYPMPLELFTNIWTPMFNSLCHNYSKISLQWNLQVLHFLFRLSRAKTESKPHLRNAQEQLLFTIFASQLPRVSCPDNARELALSLLQTQAPTNSPREIESLAETAQSRSLVAIKLVLESNNDQESETDSPSWKERVLSADCYKHLPQHIHPGHLSRIPVGGGYVPTTSIREFLLLVQNKIACATKLFWNMEMLQRDADKSGIVSTRQKVLVSLLSILIAWKSRRLVQTLGIHLSRAILAPVSELIEALKPRKVIYESRTTTSRQPLVSTSGTKGRGKHSMS